MAWTIRKIDGGHWVATDGDEVRARITLTPSASQPPAARITFPRAPAFDNDLGGTDLAEATARAIGYVRGIERAVEVNARETRGSLASIGGR